MFTAFFQDNQDIGDLDVLTKLAGEVGLDAEDFRRAMESGDYRALHQQALREAYQSGISAVPAFAIGDQLLVGVQGKHALERAMRVAGRPSRDPC